LVPVYCYGNTAILNAVGEGSRGVMGRLKRLSRVLKVSGDGDGDGDGGSDGGIIIIISSAAAGEVLALMIAVVG